MKKPVLKENSQYESDVDKLAGLVKQLAGISKSRAAQFIKETGASELFSGSYAICETDTQRAKLLTLRDFMNTLETVRDNQMNKEYYLNSSSKACDYFNSFFTGLNDREYFAAAFMDMSFRIIKSKMVFEGTIDESPLYLRELAREAIFQNCTKILISHNHPNGTTRASAADIEATREIQKTLGNLNIELIDHIIAARGKSLSMAEFNIISPGPDYLLDVGKKLRENAATKPSVREQLKSAGERVRERSVNSLDKPIGNSVHTPVKNPSKDKNAEI